MRQPPERAQKLPQRLFAPNFEEPSRRKLALTM